MVQYTNLQEKSDFIPQLHNNDYIEKDYKITLH